MSSSILTAPLLAPHTTGLLGTSGLWIIVIILIGIVILGFVIFLVTRNRPGPTPPRPGPTPPEPPITELVPPNNVSYTVASDGRLTLRWDSVPNATGYNVYSRSYNIADPMFEYCPLLTQYYTKQAVGSNSFTRIVPVDVGRICFLVTATRSAIESDPSSLVEYRK
jgi:hypothetical protein